MVALETVSTAGMSPRRKTEFWNEFACETFLPCASVLLDPASFAGTMSRIRLGNLLMAEVRAAPLTSHRSRLQVAQNREHLYFVHLQLEGSSWNQQAGREIRLEPGDFSLGDSARPSAKRLLGTRNRVLMLGIPAGLLRRHLPYPEQLIGMAMPGRHGMAALAAGFMADCWQRCVEEPSEGAVTRIATLLLEVVASTYATVLPGQVAHRSLADAHRLRVRSYIEGHLEDPALDPPRIAAACKITPRYLHHLFGSEEETVSKYILRRRLERAAGALAEAGHRHRTVTAIALDHGFVSLTHFGKVFRERYGMTPVQYRRCSLRMESYCPRSGT